MISKYYVLVAKETTKTLTKGNFYVGKLIVHTSGYWGDKHCLKYEVVGDCQQLGSRLYSINTFEIREYYEDKIDADQLRRLYETYNLPIQDGK